MKIKWLIVIIITVIVGCNSKENIESKLIYQKWFCPDQFLFIEFYDHQKGKFINYRINEIHDFNYSTTNDSLIIDYKELNYKRGQLLNLDKITTDSLTITYVEPLTKQSSYWMNFGDSLIFYPAKNFYDSNLVLDSVLIHGGQFIERIDVQISVNKDGKILFREKNIFNKTNIDTVLYNQNKLFNDLQEIVRYADIETLDSTYSDLNHDVFIYTIEIFYNKNKYLKFNENQLPLSIKTLIDYPFFTLKD